MKNYKAHGLLLLGAMGGDALIVSALKTLEQVARPTNRFFLIPVFLIRAVIVQAASFLVVCLLILLGGTGKAEVQGLQLVWVWVW